MGIPSVAIYSNADGRDSLHASMADEAYCIGHGPTPSESYLLMDEVNISLFMFIQTYLFLNKLIEY